MVHNLNACYICLANPGGLDYIPWLFFLEFASGVITRLEVCHEVTIWGQCDSCLVKDGIGLSVFLNLLSPGPTSGVFSPMVLCHFTNVVVIVNVASDVQVGYHPKLLLQSFFTIQLPSYGVERLL